MNLEGSRDRGIAEEGGGNGGDGERLPDRRRAEIAARR